MKTVETLTRDEETCARIARGDRDALAVLYEQYANTIYDFSVRILRDSAAAEDSVQTTFVNAWRHLQSRVVKGNIRAWLLTIARNVAIDHIRSSGRLVKLDDGDHDISRRLAAVDSSRMTNPEAAAVDQEIVDLVWEAAASLRPAEYALLDLHLRQGLAADELSARLGIDKGNVYTRLSRLRDSLEKSVAAAVLYKRGRRLCPDLSEIVAGAGGPRLSSETRRLVLRHADRCEICGASIATMLQPVEMFAALAIIPMSESSRAAIWTAIVTMVAAAGATAGFLTSAAAEASRWWANLGREGRAVLAGTAAGVAVMALALALVLTSGGGEPARDPSDALPVNIRSGQETTQSIITVKWSRVKGATGYSVEWTHNASDVPDTIVDLPGDATQAVSPSLGKGTWYFHLRTRGPDGDWTSTIHLGPFYVIAGLAAGASATPATIPTPAAPPQPTPEPAVAAPESSNLSASQSPTATPTPTPIRGATPTTTPSPSPTSDPKPTSTASPGTMCAGLEATIIGTDDSEIIEGTDGDDVIVSLDGRDLVHGRGGNDVICLGGADDQGFGDAGDDRIFGDDGNDQLHGGAGSDSLHGGSGPDHCHGGLGSDESDNCEKSNSLAAFLLGPSA